MTITNIEYGSLASSEILNNNFSFLEEKITNFNDEINTSISSILSNIATINTRLTEFSEALANATQESDNKLQEFKSKILIAINKTSLLPDWKNIYTISSLENYTVSTNGYIIINSQNEENIDISINGESLNILELNENNNGTIILPVKEADVIVCNTTPNSVYFIPVSKFNLDSTI